MNNVNRTKYLLKNTGILTISNFSSRILGFFFVPLYTSVLSKDDVGFYNLVVSTVELLYPILTINIVDGVVRFALDKKESKNEIVSIALRYIIICLLLGGAILISLHYLQIFPVINGYEKLIFLYYFFFIFYQFLIQFSKGTERIVEMAVAGVISSASLILFNVLFLLLLGLDIDGFFIASILSLALPSMFLFFRLNFWKYLKLRKINYDLQKEMVKYSFPLIATSIGWWVNSTADIYVVAMFCGVGGTGLLSVAYKIPSIINALQTIFIQAWQISAIREYDGKDATLFYGRVYTIINLIVCSVCAWTIILTKPLARLLFQKDFYDAWKYCPFLVLACVLNTSSGFLGPILSAKKNTKPMALSAVYGSLVNVALNFLLVYFWGIQGATIATLISSLIIYIVRKIAVHNDIKIYHYHKVLLMWGLLAVQACLEIYTNFWWGEILVMLAMLLINYNEIKQSILTMRSFAFGGMNAKNCSNNAN